MTGKLRLPPLNTLRVFHAVARHKSFRQAADELFVTPQAVGQQIKLLEDTLQVTLFERKGRTIELTESAILLSHFVDATEAFPAAVGRALASSTGALLDLVISPEALTPRQTLTRIRDAALASHKAHA